MSHYSYTMILISLLLIGLFCNTTAISGEKPLVVCTTTVLASIVNDLAGDLVSVDVIASPSVCPAHYDVRPSDVDAFARANLILMHGFEPWVKDLKEASGSKAPVVKIKGGWGTPKDLKERYKDVARALEENLGINISDRLNRCITSIDAIDTWLKEFSSSNGFTGTPVLCMMFQKEFVDYLGFNVVATYPPPEKISAKQYKSLVENATRGGAVLVVDNVQSGTDLGNKIAAEIGAVEVALTNFPGIVPHLNNMTEVMKWNAMKLSKALENARITGELNKVEEQLKGWITATYALLIVAIVEAAIIMILIRRSRR